ncbi:MAG: hypothetical protein RIS64_2221 [Bacteroidota bacterium]|jgi:hypothetical protein
MSRRDNIHQEIRSALELEGWEITHDPLPVKIGRKSTEIDLGAERILAAEKGTEKIAVEIKSFINSSVISDFYRALGQFLLYERALKIQDPTRKLYLALPFAAYDELSKDIFAYVGFEDLHHQIIVFKSNKQLLWVK